ncbi:MAG: hypothetical protein IKO44_00710 [Ruminococcus sp.]|nr:hypothetical protein [Ruminococcus sp.]
MSGSSKFSRASLSGLVCAVMLCTFFGGARQSRFLFFPRLFMSSVSEEAEDEEVHYSFRIIEFFENLFS